MDALGRGAVVADDDRQVVPALDPGRVAPDRAQCSSSIRTRSRTASRLPAVSQVSAWVATIRSVLRGPEPPTRIGSGRPTGCGRVGDVVQLVVGPSWSNRSPASRRRMMPSASSSRSSRTPGLVPKSRPCASCSRSFHAAPRPRIARPLERWSSVPRASPSGPGCGTCWRRPAGPARPLGQRRPRREHAPALERRLLPGPLDRQQVVPRQQQVPAGPVHRRRRRRAASASRSPGATAGRRTGAAGRVMATWSPSSLREPGVRIVVA